MAAITSTKNIICSKSHIIPGSSLYRRYSQKSTGKNSWELIPVYLHFKPIFALVYEDYLKTVNLIFYKQTRAGKPLGSSSDFQIFFSPKSPKKFESTRRLNFCPRDWAAAAFLFSGLYFFDHCVE